MQKLALIAIAASLAFAAPAFADDAHHPEKGQEDKAAPAKPAAKTAPTVQRMQDNVKRMQAQLDRIGKAKTDDERQTAMAEHMQTMQENMRLARSIKAGMIDCPMMQGGMMGGAMMGGGMGMMGDAPQPAGPTERMRQMEKRMDMMQMMMEQMTRRSEGQQPTPMK